MTRIVWKKIYSAFYIFNNDIRISERGPKLCCKTEKLIKKTLPTKVESFCKRIFDLNQARKIV